MAMTPEHTIYAAGRQRLALLLAGLLAGLAGCRDAPQQAPPPPPTVIVDVPARREVVPFLEYTGTTRAIRSAEIRARVTGALEQIRFEPGRLVADGEVLFVIEQAAYQAALDAARASLASARAELARADSELARIEQAIKTKAVSESDRDLARAARDQAQAAVLGAQAKLEQAELDYGYTTVRAPFGGVVGRNLVDVGNLVGQGQATLLATINDIQPIYAYFNVPEQVVLERLAHRDIRRDQPVDELDSPPSVHVATEIDDDYPHEGVIDYVDNTVDPSTGTIEVRAVLPNEDVRLFPGLFVRVRVPLPPIPDSILVENAAVGTDLKGNYVLLVGDDDVVELRYVELGPVQDDGMVPVLEGLEGGERYIVEGVLKARPGLPVTPQGRGQGA